MGCCTQTLALGRVCCWFVWQPSWWHRMQAWCPAPQWCWWGLSWQSRSGFGWAKGCRGSSGGRAASCGRLTQIKQPKKNKGRSQPKAVPSIFFQAHFSPHPLSLPTWGSRNWSCGGERPHAEPSVPLPRAPAPHAAGAAPSPCLGAALLSLPTFPAA